jgi:WbqC-like protein family
MKGVILQPGYIPWLGFFNQMALADHFVYLDDIQYDRRGWRNRNRIRGPNGPVWLTVPVVQKGQYDQILLNTRIDRTVKWQRKHLNAIRLYYAKTRFFTSYFPALETLLSQDFEYLVELDLAVIDLMRDWLGITTPVSRASTLSIENTDKTGRLVEISQKTGIKEYISGPLCENYLELAQFTDAEVDVYFHEYSHPEYRQHFSPFTPYLSTLDLLLNEGPGSFDVLFDPESLELRSVD